VLFGGQDIQHNSRGPLENQIENRIETTSFLIWTPLQSPDIFPAWNFSQANKRRSESKGILNAKYQVHGYWVDLTIRNISGVDPTGGWTLAVANMCQRAG